MVVAVAALTAVAADIVVRIHNELGDYAPVQYLREELSL